MDEQRTPDDTAAEVPATQQDGEPTEATKVDFDLGATVRELGPVVTSLFAATLIFPILGQILLYMNIGRIGAWFEARGAAAAWIFAGAFALTTGTALMPTYALSGVAGYLFGFQVGGLVAMAGVTGGAVIGYIWALVLAQGRVMQVIERHPKARVIRKALVDRGFLPETGVVTLIRFPPNSPFALTNFTMGSARVNPVVCFIGTVVGIAPRTLLAVFVGNGIRTAGEQLGEGSMKIDTDLRIAGIVATLVVLIIIYQLFSRWSRAALRRLSESGESGECQGSGE